MVESGRKAYERGKLSFEKYCNSTPFSDITIRYGAEGERIFYSHKLLLSSKSYWFEAAFAGRFIESEAQELQLKDDDPDLLEAMLAYAYNGSIKKPAENGSIENVHFCVGLYRVADKYDFPDLELYARRIFLQAISSYVHELAKVSQPISDGLCEIVRDVYALTGPRNSGSHPLVDTLIEHITFNKPLRPTGNRGSKFHAVLVDAARETAEFGRDVFVSLMAYTNGSTNLEIVCEVKCPECDEKWMRTLSANPHGCCPCCGNYVEDWEDWAYFESTQAGS